MKIVQNPGYRSLFIYLILLLTGCVSIPEIPKPTNNYSGPIEIGSGIILHIPSDLNAQERALLISAATTQLDEFERDWGAPSKPVHVWFDRGKDGCIPCGDLKGRFWGCHYGDNGPIHIWLDDLFTSIVLYHELVHHNNEKDHDHKDPRWETHWEPKQLELIKTLRKKHKRILGRRGGD